MADRILSWIVLAMALVNAVWFAAFLYSPTYPVYLKVGHGICVALCFAMFMHMRGKEAPDG